MNASHMMRSVAHRFRTADILTKGWLMGVKRGWASLLKAKPHGWPEVYRAFDRLIQFVENLEEQVFFVRRGPYTGILEMAEGRKVKELLTQLRLGVIDEKNKAKHWQRVLEQTTLPGFDPEDGQKMLDLYGRDFEDAVNAKQLTTTLEKVLKLLREDAAEIVKHDERFPEDPYKDRSAFKEFDLYGMKVVVDDRTVTPGQVNRYINYLDEAYQLLKQKGFAKAWYGTVFIQCEGCGGVNQNTGGGTGGSYAIDKDTVQVYTRPGSFIVELMVHELGHRYWFKQMSQTQRAKFESLVRVHKRQAPGVSYSERTISESKVKEAKQAVEKALAPLRDLLKQFGQSKAKWWKEPIERFRDKIASAGWDAQNDLLTAMHQPGANVEVSPEVKAQFRHALERNGKLSEFCRNLMFEIEEEVRATPEPAKAPKNFDKYWWEQFERVRPKWLEKAELVANEAEANAFIYIDLAVKTTNDLAEEKAQKTRKEWEDEWTNDPRQVLPVSDYGKSNIDEAWAEVFAHYVMGVDMNRDQIESFKSVLKTGTLHSVTLYHGTDLKTAPILRANAYLTTDFWSAASYGQDKNENEFYVHEYVVHDPFEIINPQDPHWQQQPRLEKGYLKELGHDAWRNNEPLKSSGKRWHLTLRPEVDAMRIQERYDVTPPAPSRSHTAAATRQALLLKPNEQILTMVEVKPKVAQVVERYKQALASGGTRLASRVVACYKAAKIETVDETWIENLRKDFLTLVKNIPRVNSYEDGAKLRDALKIYRTKFRKFFFDSFLNRFKENDDASFEGIRKVAWDFYTELSMPLGYPDEYNSKESLYNRYKSEASAWDKRVRSKAQMFWKNLKETLEYRIDKKVEVTVPDRDRLVFEGFQVEMRAYDQSSDWQQNSLYKMREALKQYKRKASKYLPWLIQKQLPLVFNFDSKLNEGGLYEGDHISIAMSALAGESPEWGVHILAHEMGHHLFKGLSKGARVFWDEAIRQDYGPLDLEELLSVWPTSLKYGDEFTDKWALKDPTLALQVSVLGQERGGASAYSDRSDFVDALERGVKTLPVPKHPITGYAGKNTEEAFCEAIGRLVGYGPATVHPQIREWLRIAIPGMVKLSSQIVLRFKQAERSKKIKLGFRIVDIRTGEPYTKIAPRKDDKLRDRAKQLTAEGKNVGIQTVEIHVPESWKKGDSLEQWAPKDVLEGLR